ncbi:hypothetical protein DFR44_1425 [Hydromonas duriensis]|uniref:Uncharacterized protein n=1 Tax=Hydromonas duriensis TaxID=1527608 RepID=A0A4R6Y0H1_9BURK|nr:hypothetical protein DFR44_1425 [Hydromonas duriensis]
MTVQHRKRWEARPWLIQPFGGLFLVQMPPLSEVATNTCGVRNAKAFRGAGEAPLLWFYLLRF